MSQILPVLLLLQLGGSKADVELGVALLREQIRLDAAFLAEPIHQRKHMHLCIERERRIRGFSAILKLLGENQ
jgi:hypothetical protein